MVGHAMGSMSQRWISSYLSVGEARSGGECGAGEARSTRTGHPAAGAPHYGVVSVEHVLYRVPMIPLFRHAPGEVDPTFFLDTDMWDL